MKLSTSTIFIAVALLSRTQATVVPGNANSDFRSFLANFFGNYNKGVKTVTVTALPTGAGVRADATACAVPPMSAVHDTVTQTLFVTMPAGGEIGNPVKGIQDKAASSSVSVTESVLAAASPLSSSSTTIPTVASVTQIVEHQAPFTATVTLTLDGKVVATQLATTLVSTEFRTVVPQPSVIVSTIVHKTPKIVTAMVTEAGKVVQTTSAALTEFVTVTQTAIQETAISVVIIGASESQTASSSTSQLADLSESKTAVETVSQSAATATVVTESSQLSSTPCPTDPVTVTVTVPLNSASDSTDSATQTLPGSAFATTSSILDNVPLTSTDSASTTSVAPTDIASASIFTSTDSASLTLASSTDSTSSTLVTSTDGASTASVSASLQTTTATETGTTTSDSPAVSQTEDAQTSRNLDRRVVQEALKSDGNPGAGEVPSLTSENNFINFCLTQDVPLTNGQQIKTGSCNPTPMGSIVAQDKIPSATFQFPKNFDTIPANTKFNVEMKIKNLISGNFVNAAANYYGAPAQVDGSGTLIGHSHVVIQLMDDFAQKTPLNPLVFAFFKGLNAPAANGILTAEVTGGLPAGKYRIASINSAANHQPALASIEQHGSVDAFGYFTVV